MELKISEILNEDLNQSKINYTDYLPQLGQTVVSNPYSCKNQMDVIIIREYMIFTRNDQFSHLTPLQIELIYYSINLMNQYNNNGNKIYTFINFHTLNYSFVVFKSVNKDCNILTEVLSYSQYSLFKYILNQYFICKKSTLFSHICYTLQDILPNNVFIISNNLIVTNNKVILQMCNASNERRIEEKNNITNQFICKNSIVCPIKMCYYNKTLKNSKSIKSDRYCTLEDYQPIISDCKSTDISREIYFIRKSSSECIENSTNKPQNNTIECQHLPITNYMTIITIIISIFLIITIIVAQLIVIWSFHHNFISHHKIHYIIATLCSFMISEIFQLLLNTLEMSDNKCYIFQSFHTLFITIGLILMRIAYDHVIEEEINTKVIPKKGHIIYLCKSSFIIAVQIFIVFFITNKHLLMKEYIISDYEIVISYCGKTNEQELTTNLIPV